MENSATFPYDSRPQTFSGLSTLFQQNSRKSRVFLLVMLILVMVGMVIGILFVAHYYFHMWGGQGFLKVRENLQDLGDTEKILSCLPLQHVAKPTLEIHGFDYDIIKKSGSTLPFYVCGDQQNSCEFYSQPNVCCPVGMACHSTPFSNSGTFCCMSTGSEPECQSSAMRPPQCPQSTFECAVDVGGGCCPVSAICSPNGCIEFNGDGTPPPITSTIITTLVYATASKAMGASLTTEQTESATLVVTTRTTTVTMIIGGPTTPTATSYKQGAEAQRAQGTPTQKAGWPSRRFPYSPLMLLMAVALGIALL